MTRFILILAPLPALILFPSSFFMVLVAISAFVFPLSGVLYGLLADVLYYAPGVAPFPHGIVYGLAATIAGFLLSRFVRTHIGTGVFGAI